MVAFNLAWDDFTGGYFVGASHANQPIDTFRGTGVYADPNDGMLNAVPDWTAITNTGTPTAQTGTFSEMWTDGTAIWKVYTVAGNLLNFAYYADSGSASTRIVTNYTVSNVTALLDTEAWTDSYIFASYTPSSGAANLVRYTTADGTRSTYTTPENLRFIARWGEFMVGAGNTVKYRLYYSNAYDPTTWGVSDFYSIGDAGAITAVVPLGDALYVGKADGWYVLTGVLGEDVTVRRIGEGYPGPNGWVGTVEPGSPLSNAVASPFGALFTSTQFDVTAAVINGNTVNPVNYAAPDRGTSSLVSATGTWNIHPITPGVYLLTMNHAGLNSSTNTAAWWLDTTLGRPRWAKLSIPYTAPGGTWVNVPAARYLPNTAARGTVYLSEGASNTTIYYANLYPSEDLTSGSVTGVAHLAEQRKTDPFNVRELYVEVCWLASASAAPSVSVAVEVRGWGDLPVPGRVAATAVTVTPTVHASIPTSALYHDDRFVYATIRYNLDAPAATAVVPIVSFSECKIRRVWAKCDYQGKS